MYPTCHDIDTDNITSEGLDIAIKQLKRNKAPGPDGTTSELYKLLDTPTRNLLLETINECWNSETLHDSMNEANLAIIFKKGNPELPQNYRPIALLNIAYKILAMIILKRIVPHIDDRTDKSQYGFRKKRSTAQPLFILRRAQEMQEEAGLETHILLLDWEKAFDKVSQKKLLTALSRIGIPPKIVTMIKAIYENPQFSIKDASKTTENRKQHTGIRQGCPLSPYLFVILLTIMMKDITDDMTPEEKLTLDEGKLNHEVTKNLFYADGTIIMTSTAQATQLFLHKIQNESKKYGMKLNHNKCEHIRLNAIHRTHFENGEEVPTTQNALYLGSRIHYNGDQK